MASTAEAVKYKAEQVDSSYYPNIILSDRFGYTRLPRRQHRRVGNARVSNASTRKIS